MAFPFPADKLEKLPAADGADREVSRKSKSRRARRNAKDEARLLQSYIMVDMDDLEEQKDDPQLLKKPRKRGDTTWRKFSSVESSSSESGVMVGYASSSLESSARSSSEASLVSGFRQVSISSTSAAEGAELAGEGRTSDPAASGADKSESRTPQVTETSKVLPGFGRSTDFLKGSPTMTTVTEVDTQRLTQVEAITD